MKKPPKRWNKPTLLGVRVDKQTSQFAIY